MITPSPDNYFAVVADSHALMALHADSEAEAAHWRAECRRFTDLARLARTDPVAARAAYRPTRAYQPEEQQ